ncbi:MAG TPA: c-type cytochrome [Gemmatimonadales bacterium]|nr:c-type cytochrome [Gemmatimonadales bacterium]
MGTRSRFLSLVLAAVSLLGACAGAGTSAGDSAALVERGRYLTVVGACHDCHTPKVMTPAGPTPDTTRMLSGHPADMAVGEAPGQLPATWFASTNGDLTAWAGPWGVSFTANLTPSKYGLAGWTPEMFIQTIRQGKHAGVGRALLPPMPWANYAQMKDEDLRAIFAYLQSLPPIDNRVPAPRPPATQPSAARAGSPGSRAG